MEMIDTLRCATMARPVIEAIRSGDVSLAKKLLQTHTYTCIDCQTHRKDGTALFWAACRGLLEVVQILLSRGANVNARTGYDATPLHAAADANKVHVIRFLLENGADVNCLTVTGDTACHLAAYRGHCDAVKLLVMGGADLNMRNRKHHRPIDEAASGDYSQIVEYLEKQSNLDSQTNDDTDISLHDANVNCNLQLQTGTPTRSTSTFHVEHHVTAPSVNFNTYYHYDAMTHTNPYAGTQTLYVANSNSPDNDLSINTDIIPNNDRTRYLNIPLK